MGRSQGYLKPEYVALLPFPFCRGSRGWWDWKDIGVGARRWMRPRRQPGGRLRNCLHPGEMSSHIEDRGDQGCPYQRMELQIWIGWALEGTLWH